jgi:formylglycine-generating enzyme required for sulfatase activity
VQKVSLGDSVYLELVYVRGGTFTMGNGTTPKGVKLTYEASRPEHQVTVGDYFIGRYEVTQAQWRAVMDTVPSHFTGDSLPVEQVSWDDAQQFCAMLSQRAGMRFRLPTEAEWEYAARGGSLSKRCVFAGSNDRDECAWYCVNSGGQTHRVGLLKPNELGLYDMSGNVAEWCGDWMASYDDMIGSDGEPLVNPRGPRSGDSRVLRGGHYNSTSPCCTVYDRGWYLPTGRYEFYGLRLVMEPPQPDKDEE